MFASANDSDSGGASWRPRSLCALAAAAIGLAACAGGDGNRAGESPKDSNPAAHKAGAPAPNGQPPARAADHGRSAKTKKATIGAKGARPKHVVRTPPHTAAESANAGAPPQGKSRSPSKTDAAQQQKQQIPASEGQQQGLSDAEKAQSGG